MKAESLDTSYLARPDGAGPFPGVVVVHEAFGLNDNIRDICGRLVREGRAQAARGDPPPVPGRRVMAGQGLHDQGRQGTGIRADRRGDPA